MNEKPDFYQISRKELKSYVLSHREDEEALRIYRYRRRTEPGIIRYMGGLNEEDFQQLEGLIKKSISKHEA